MRKIPPKEMKCPFCKTLKNMQAVDDIRRKITIPMSFALLRFSAAKAIGINTKSSRKYDNEIAASTINSGTVDFGSASTLE